MADPTIANYLAARNTPPPPLNTNIAMPGPAPSMGSPVLPSVSLAPPPPPTQTQRDQTERDRLINTGSGIDQVQNPLLRGIARAADIAGSVFAPKLAQFIPGTTLHHQLLVGQATNNVAKDQAEEQAAAQTAGLAANTAHTQAETTGLPTEQADKHALSGAQTANLASETDARDNPSPQFEVHDTAAGPLFVNKQTGQAQHLSVDGLPIGPKIQTKTVQLQVGGKPHQVLVNDSTGEPIKDLGESGEKPPTVNVNAGLGALDRETKQFGAPYQKSLDSSNAQLEKIADARAMINGNAEAQGLGIPKVLTALVGGQGTGVRITQAELTSIAHARGLSGDVEGTLSKWAGKGALTGEQQRQLTQIMDDVKARLVQKQAIASQTLDTVNGATTREQIVQADRDARKQLSDLEGGNTGSTSGGSSGMAVSLKDAMALPQNKGKSEDDVTKDIKAHGHTVRP